MSTGTNSYAMQKVNVARVDVSNEHKPLLKSNEETIIENIFLRFPGAVSATKTARGKSTLP